ncbi:MAG TPA: hypothetical protein VGM76_14440 [Lacipirellulaceae bacterium]|jgi:hypothetical protein
MKRARKIVRIVVCAAAASWITLVAIPVHAAFHFWQISEVFSNSDGSVQFIELFSSSGSQNFTHSGIPGGTKITSGTNTYTFPSDIDFSIDTTNKHMLLATAGFAALAGGISPDFATAPLPAHFFNPAGDTITYQGTLFAPATFGPSSTALPTDGVHSLTFPGAGNAVNSPTNLAGNAGSVNLPPPVTPTGDYNGNSVVDAADYTVWRDSLGQTVTTAGTQADGDKSGKIDTGDYTFWVSKFGNVLPGSGGGAGSAGAVPEPATLLLGMAALSLGALLLRAAHRRLSAS